MTTFWVVVRLKKSLVTRSYRYCGLYDRDLPAIREANWLNYGSTGYQDLGSKFFAYPVNVESAQERLLRELVYSGDEHPTLRFGPDAWHRPDG